MTARRRHEFKPKGMFAILSVLVAAGCANNQVAPQADIPAPVTNDPVALFAASASPGSEGNVVLPETGQSVRVRMIRSYAAASGRECREIGVGPSLSQRVVCRAGDGWVMARPLLSGSTAIR